MKISMRRVALAGMLALSTSAALADVTVNFVKPDEYASMPRMPDDRDVVLKDLGEHIQRLGVKLPAGTDLQVDVLELRMAGRVHPNRRGGDDLRILNGGADWPTMRLHYTLKREGKVVADGEDRLSNMDYFARSHRADAEQTYIYEKQMIDDWFSAKVVNVATAAR